MREVRVHGLRVGHCLHPEIMSIKGGRWTPVEFPALAQLLIHPVEGAILFDTGYDPAFVAATAPFPERFYRWLTPMTLPPGKTAAEQIRRFGVSAAEVRHVVVSHFHADHVAGLHAFARARIHCARAGLTAACGGGCGNRLRQGFLAALLPPGIAARVSFFEECRRASLSRDLLPFADGADVLGDGSLLAVELPGHCPGHWGLVVREAGAGLHFLVADAAWSSDAIRRNRPPPRVTTAMLGDTARARETLARLHALRIRSPDLQMTPSHCRECAARIEAGR